MKRLLLALLLSAAPAGAQLTPGDVSAAALRAHPTIVAAEAALARAAAAEREARAGWLPTLQLDASAMHFAEPMVVAPLHGFDPMNPPRFDETLYQGGVSLSYTLFDGGARRARTQRSASLSDAADAASAAMRAALLAQVTAAYVRVSTGRELLVAQRARLDAVRSERARAAALLEQGRVAELVLLRADAALSGAAADTVTARMQLLLAERVLSRLTSLPVEGEALRALPALPEPAGRAELLQRALDANADVARARAQVRAQEQGTREARALFFPRLQLVGRYAEYGSSEGREQGEWQAGLQLGYPLFTGGTRAAARDRAGADLNAARAELQLAELRVADAVDAALTNLLAARARAAALSTALSQAQEVARIERLALAQGAGVQTDYLAAEADLLRSRAALAEARAAEVVAHVELARATGDLSITWLRSNLERAQ